MKKYLSLDLTTFSKDLSPFSQPSHVKLHYQVVLKEAMSEIEKHIDVTNYFNMKLGR